MTRAQIARYKELFIEHFARTANITTAAEIVGISRRVVYVWLEKDEQFSLAFNEANAIATERLEAEAWRRGVEGVTNETPIMHQGQQVGTLTETKYSDVLLMFMLKARNPGKYREKAPPSSNPDEQYASSAVEKFVRDQLGAS